MLKSCMNRSQCKHNAATAKSTKRPSSNCFEFCLFKLGLRRVPIMLAPQVRTVPVALCLQHLILKILVALPRSHSSIRKLALSGATSHYYQHLYSSQTTFSFKLQVHSQAVEVALALVVVCSCMLPEILGRARNPNLPKSPLNPEP